MSSKVVKHDKLNFVFISDLHFSAIPLGRRSDDYVEALFAKLEFVRELTQKIKGVCLVGGDVFHHKLPKHPGNSLAMIERLIRVFGSFPTGQVVGTEGNHDLSFDSHASLPNQPLGILIAAGVYHNLVEEPALFVNQDESVKVSVESFPYVSGERVLKQILGAPPRLPGITARVGLVHAYGQPGNEGTMYGEPKIGYNQLKNSDFDCLFWGHDHSRSGIEEVGNVTHVRLGSLARAAFDYDELDRVVAAAVFSFAIDGTRCKEVPIPVKPIDLVFSKSDKGMEQVRKSDAVTELFAEMDEAVGEIDINSADFHAVLRALCPDDPKLVQFVEELCV